jgi:hypothetical protein
MDAEAGVARERLLQRLRQPGVDKRRVGAESQRSADRPRRSVLRARGRARRDETQEQGSTQHVRAIIGPLRLGSRVRIAALKRSSKKARLARLSALDSGPHDSIPVLHNPSGARLLPHLHSPTDA